MRVRIKLNLRKAYESLTGIEPANFWLSVTCPNHLRYTDSDGERRLQCVLVRGDMCTAVCILDISLIWLTPYYCVFVKFTNTQYRGVVVLSHFQSSLLRIYVVDKRWSELTGNQNVTGSIPVRYSKVFSEIKFDTHAHSKL